MLILVSWATDARIRYIERFIEFLTDLVSQAPTRRHVNALLWDMHFIVAIELSPIYLDKRNQLLRGLLDITKRFLKTPIDEDTGCQLTPEESELRYHKQLARLQRIALKNFKDKLTILALSNFGALQDSKELSSHLETLEESELQSLCGHLGLRTTYPTGVGLHINKFFLREILLFALTKSTSFEDYVRECTTLPTEVCPAYDFLRFV